MKRNTLILVLLGLAVVSSARWAEGSSPEPGAVSVDQSGLIYGVDGEPRKRAKIKGPHGTTRADGSGAYTISYEVQPGAEVAFQVKAGGTLKLVAYQKIDGAGSLSRDFVLIPNTFKRFWNWVAENGPYQDGTLRQLYQPRWFIYDRGQSCVDRFCTESRAEAKLAGAYRRALERVARKVPEATGGVFDVPEIVYVKQPKGQVTTILVHQGEEIWDTAIVVYTSEHPRDFAGEVSYGVTPFPHGGGVIEQPIVYLYPGNSFNPYGSPDNLGSFEKTAIHEMLHTFGWLHPFVAGATYTSVPEASAICGTACANSTQPWQVPALSPADLRLGMALYARSPGNWGKPNQDRDVPRSEWPRIHGAPHTAKSGSPGRKIYVRHRCGLNDGRTGLAETDSPLLE